MEEEGKEGEGAGEGREMDVESKRKRGPGENQSRDEGKGQGCLKQSAIFPDLNLPIPVDSFELPVMLKARIFFFRSCV
jgi:hypothetical protein